MAIDEYPAALTAVHWEKKKVALPPGSPGLADRLKALQRRHGGVEWATLKGDWTAGIESTEALEQAYALRERILRGGGLALKRDAVETAAAAQKAQKGADKPVSDATKAIAAAANELADGIDAALVALKGVFDGAAKKLAAAAAKAAKEPEVLPPGALLDPKRLLAQLSQCLRDPAYRAEFGFVDGKEKQLPVLAMHRSTSGRKLYADLAEATGVKAGAYGTAWIQERTLILQVDKKLSGLVKKIRVPVQKCGFRIARIVLWGPDGAVLEQDDDDRPDGAAASPDAPATTAPTDPADGGQAAAYQARRAGLLPRITTLLKADDARAGKLRALLGFVEGKAAAGDWLAAGKGLDAIGDLLEPAAPAAPARPSVAAPAPAADAAPVASAVRATAPVSTRIAFTQSRLLWDQTRREILKELRRLESAVLEECRNEPDFAEIRANSGVLYTVLDYLDERLIDELDRALNAATPQERKAHNEKALVIVDEYLDFARTDTLLADIGANGFVDLAIPQLLETRLADMSAKLRAVI